MPATPVKIFAFLLPFLWLLQQPLHAQQKQVIGCSPPKWPLMVQSNEAEKEQLALAKAEGDSVDMCVDWLLQEAGNKGGRIHAGEYLVTYIIAPAEGWYELRGNALAWRQPASADNAHLWVFVQDASDHRIVPGLIIKADVVNERGTVSSKSIPFVWTPLINGYGENIHLSPGGSYQLYLTIGPPRYHRHDPYNGDRFTEISKVMVGLNLDRDSLGDGPLSKAMEEQQALSKAVGQAYRNTLKAMYKQATAGKDTLVGDYFIAFADEYGEGYWHYKTKNSKLTYMVQNEQSAENNAHVEVAVCDARTGRFLHDLAVRATLYLDDREIGTKDEPFMWHPWLFHYGENWRVPSSSRKYRLHIHAAPPAYRRYGKTLGKQFTRPAEAEFNNVWIKTGEK